MTANEGRNQVDIPTMKLSQHDEEESLLIVMLQAKLAALSAEVELSGRSLRNVTGDEVEQAVMTCFENYAAELNAGFGTSREDFLQSMGEAFDAAVLEVTEDEPPKPS